MEQKRFEASDYERVIDFLIKLNETSINHINWNWARFEWMYEHPMFDKTLLSRIGLWTENNEVIGCAIYDMFLGEASVLVLPEYYHLYKEILNYAYENLKDDDGLKVAVTDGNELEIKLIEESHYQKIDQSETIMSIDLVEPFSFKLNDTMSFAYLDPINDYDELCWLFWQGFDHGDDKEECMKENTVKSKMRPHFIPYLSVTVKCDEKYIGHCSIWYNDKTDYAYLEPVCVIPEYRNKGVAKAMIYEALNRAKELGAKRTYVISDMEFYEKLGFKRTKHYTFYQKTK